MRERPSFANVLNTLATSARPPAPGPAFANPLATAAPPIVSSDAEGPGEGTPWDHAFAWAPDFLAPDDSDREPAPFAPRDDPEAIAVELNLARAATSAELDHARREFMWRNHPDRRPDIPSELANRRVAIANMLIDRALIEFAERRRRG